MNNQYTGFTEYYDLWVTSGYYNYQDIAKETHSVIGNGRQIIELGVGTGLLAQEYINIDPTCEFTGVDFTSSLLEIAEKRLENRVKLIEADAVTMDLNTKFDVAISNGGVWGILDLGDKWEFGGHVAGIEANSQGLRNVAYHLKEGGLLLLHLQKPHPNYEKSIGEGIIYSQSIEEVEDTVDYHTLLKSYLFKKEEEIVVQEQIKITCFKPEISEKLLSEAGFDFQGTSNGDRFAIYKKR
ncbi:class I SAM-dependent methyltransferase [Okeania sp.]|uniref:class I SAM-dependent methyltransferase n=1 Tax=Okeania sp. TaxID=3100323 RepID=UPI002B4B621D|nr:class I SAM-dependent methyltransferase [Okeania sp.]MEB3341535.1 class I SAM-dependent methyltransferase [Okeania sp.]